MAVTRRGLFAGIPLRDWISWALMMTAALVGLKLGIDFGMTVAGRWLAVITGVNAALMAALLVQAVVQAVLKVWDRRKAVQHS